MQWAGGRVSPKSRQKEQNQLICDSDRGSINPKILRTLYMEAPVQKRWKYDSQKGHGVSCVYDFRSLPNIKSPNWRCENHADAFGTHTQKCRFMEKRVGEISRFFVAQPPVFPLSVRARPRTSLYTNTSTLVNSHANLMYSARAQDGPQEMERN